LSAPISCLFPNLERCLTLILSLIGELRPSLTLTLIGGSYPADIYSLAFNTDSSLIAVSSSSGTVHAFKLDEASKRGSEEQAGSMSGMLTGYMPGMMSDMLDPRSFAQVKLKAAGVATLCAINSDSTQIHVVTSDGFFYTYEIPGAGGECRLVKEASLK
jgi:WD40 repeat protein